MFRQPCPVSVLNEDIHVFIDPAAGGPYSDYAVVSVTRQKGLVTVFASRSSIRRLFRLIIFLHVRCRGFQDRAEHDVRVCGSCVMIGFYFILNTVSRLLRVRDAFLLRARDAFGLG
jgi:hypothetical protein